MNMFIRHKDRNRQQEKTDMYRLKKHRLYLIKSSIIKTAYELT